MAGKTEHENQVQRISAASEKGKMCYRNQERGAPTALQEKNAKQASNQTWKK
jgi:hypothetical protein